MLVVVGLVVFAASPVVTWNDKLLFILTDSSTLTRYWSIFRSTGRIIWPVNYLIYTAVIVCNARLWNSKKSAVVGSVVLALCCFLQVFEISENFASREHSLLKKTYASPFQDSIWKELSERKQLKHLVWVSNNYENKEILELSKWAYDNMLTMNNFYFARESVWQRIHNPVCAIQMTHTFLCLRRK